VSGLYEWIMKAGRRRARERALALCLPVGVVLMLRAGLSCDADLADLPAWAAAGAILATPAAVTLADAARVYCGGAIEVCSCRQGVTRDLPVWYVRLSRATVGVAACAAAVAVTSVSLPAGIVFAWAGFSHLVAAVIGYAGCPELGAVSSLLLRRDVRTGCSPWCRADSQLLRCR
jgi:hypothetical protein